MDHRLLLDSRPEEVDRLLDWVEPLLAASSLEEMDSFHFRCALVEIVNNCIRHAYRFEPGHPVEVILEFETDRVNAIVRDQGPDFAPPAEAPISAPTAESGRGYEIIHAWVDEILFERDSGWNSCRISRRLG